MRWEVGDGEEGRKATSSTARPSSPLFSRLHFTATYCLFIGPSLN